MSAATYDEPQHGRGPTGQRRRTASGARPRLAVAALAASLSLGVHVTAASPADAGWRGPRVPAATLTPVHVPGTNAMTAAAVDLRRHGYTEREFYATGQAHRYRGAVIGTLTDARVIDGGWDYTTRALVRYPGKERFNGTLVVEWFNVTAGQDIDFAWAESHEYLLRQGYAVAAVSAQRIGVERLKTWSPERYTSLSVDADNVDPQGGGTVDATNDPLSWDVMAQVSAALKANAGPLQPMPGLHVRRVLALGESQSGVRLTTYYNAIHPLHRFFDGFVFLDRATQLRDDRRTPAVSVNTEATSNFPVPTSSRYVRYWDVAGASHASLYGARYVDALVLRDRSIPGPSGPLSFTQVIEAQNCGFLPLFSTVDTGLVLNAALDSVNRWVTTGRPAAPSALYAREPDGTLTRDAEGRVVGGVRLSHFDVPTEFVLGRNTGTQFCQLSGHHRPYTAAELESRYGTHRTYVARVVASTAAAVRAGYLLPADAAAVIRTAVRSDVAR
jgi:hypothetical protein